MKSNQLILLFASMAWMLVACTSTAPQEITPTSAYQTPVTQEPPVGLDATEPPNPLNIEDQLAQVDAILQQSTQASIAFNAPSEMRVDETVTIELLLNPSLSPDDLKKKISEPGTINTSSVEITPLMKARLVPQDRSAFSIVARPDEENAVQVISSKDTTKWSWNVTAQKSGPQRLTIFLSRLVKYENEEHWREVGEYEADIVVQVTPFSLLKASGWKWIAALLIALVAVSVIRRRRTQPRKRTELKAGPTGENLGRIFISYRRADSADIAGRIYDVLVEEFGRDLIFKDVDSIPLGIDFKQYLDRKVRECRVLLAIIGDHWLAASDEAGKKRLEDPADFVRIEIESALASEIPVIPLLVSGAKMPLEKDLPSSLRKLVFKNGIPIRPDPDFHHDMDRLISALNKYI